MDLRTVPLDVIVTADDTRVAPNFKLSEFRCPHCGLVRITAEFMDLVARLQVVRSRIQAPITISSGGGWRCPVYAAELAEKNPKAAPDSRHMIAAADISSPVGLTRLLEEARKTFTGIGVYSSHIHVDLGPVREWRG